MNQIKPSCEKLNLSIFQVVEMANLGGLKTPHEKLSCLKATVVCIKYNILFFMYKRANWGNKKIMFRFWLFKYDK